MTTHNKPTGDWNFVKKVMAFALLIRLLVVIVFGYTDAIFELRLSPDSEAYHREAIEINTLLEHNIATHRTWQDHGWFRFTALVYRVFGDHAWIMQLINVIFSVATVYVVYRLTLLLKLNRYISRMAILFMAFFPSLIFWSTLMIKDPVAILAMTTLMTGAFALRQSFSVHWLLASIASIVVFFGTRDYMFFIASVVFVASLFLFVENRGKSLQSVTLASIFVICILPWFLGVGIFGYKFFTESIYFDIDFINHTRRDIGDHGTGAMFDHDEVGLWTDDIWNNIQVAAKGVFYFFFIIDFKEIDSVRQIMALPEVILAIILLPAFYNGCKTSWRHRSKLIPLLIFTFIIMAVYLSVTTNMGALFRWKMQVMPAICILIAMGLNTKQEGKLYRITSLLCGVRKPKAQRRIRVNA